MAYIPPLLPQAAFGHFDLWGRTREAGIMTCNDVSYTFATSMILDGLLPTRTLL